MAPVTMLREKMKTYSVREKGDRRGKSLQPRLMDTSERREMR
jgi:hypothetical protein